MDMTRLDFLRKYSGTVVRFNNLESAQEFENICISFSMPGETSGGPLTRIWKEQGTNTRIYVSFDYVYVLTWDLKTNAAFHLDPRATALYKLGDIT
jgi:hypothetical protein